MADPRPLTRDTLAKFLPDRESIRRFERLFYVVGDLTPADIATLTRLSQEASIDANTAQASAQSALDQLGQIIQDAAINAGAADGKATQALDLLGRIAQSLELLATAPTVREDNFIGTDYIDVNTVAPTAVGGVSGRMKWNDTDGTLDLGLKGGNVTLQIGQENVLLVKNNEATPLVDGEVVYVSGASGANLLVKRALADSDVTSASTIGVVTEQIAVNGQGFITTFGSVRGLNTNSFNEGDILYLSPTIPGAIVNVKPVAPQHMVTVGYCTKKSGGNGEVFVKVDNGYEVDELHNVLITNPVLAGSLLIYDSTVGVWKNARLTAGTNVTITNADGSVTIAVAGAAPTGSAGGVLSGTYPNPGFAVDMATQSELDAAIATREPTIAAGTTAQYWRGNKTWQDLFTQVRAATLTGLSTATNAVITAADTVLSALGKLQKQISDNLTTLTSHTDNTSNPHSTTAVQVGADPSGTASSAIATHVAAADPHTQYGLKSGKLNQFAATTSAELAGVISDETGAGKLMFGTNPITTRTSSSAAQTTRGINSQAGTAHTGNLLQHAEFYAPVSLGTKLRIPIVSNGGFWVGHTIRVTGVGARYNSTVPLGFTADCTFSTATSILNLSSLGVTGNAASINVSGMYIEINFTTAYTATYGGVMVRIEHLCQDPNTAPIDYANIAMN